MSKIDEYLNEMRDEENPEFLFNMVPTSLILDIVNKKVDIMYLAKKSLADRGVDKKGKWIGTDKAEKLWRV